MPTASNAQSVDSTTISSELFDTLAYRNVREQYHAKLVVDQRNEITALKGIIETGNVKLEAEKSNHKVDSDLLAIRTKELDHQIAVNTRWKIGGGIVIIGEAIGGAYFAIQSLFKK